MSNFRKDDILITDITDDLRRAKLEYEKHKTAEQARPAMPEMPAFLQEEPVSEPAEVIAEKEPVVLETAKPEKEVLTAAEEVQPVLSETVETGSEQTISEDEETDKKKKGKTRKKKEYPYRISWYTRLLIVVDVIAIICFYVFYGPQESIKSWLITTAITTGKHKYLAYILYDQKEITKVLSENAFIGVKGETDASKIQFMENPDTGYYINEYDKQIVKKDYEDQRYKIINFDEDDCKGYIAVIYHPDSLNLVTAPGIYGATMTEYAERNNASVAINAGGHYLYEDNSISPMGGLIIDGKIVHNAQKDYMVCMTYDNVLLLHRGTPSEAIAKNVKWGLYFVPFLIVNGVSASYSGNGGLGVRPRTAIGQREDGIILLVVIDGSSGASMPQLIRIFERYGCVNAANL
ncbi:MAG: phosphodiester glycosidase family protein, partial [Erysipelotrichaceae bacterium]|nr:phosphodiester glycosidase family protein [Erysipelotrichaceae bacterium]